MFASSPSFPKHQKSLQWPFIFFFIYFFLAFIFCYYIEKALRWTAFLFLSFFFSFFLTYLFVLHWKLPFLKKKFFSLQSNQKGFVSLIPTITLKKKKKTFFFKSLYGSICMSGNKSLRIVYTLLLCFILLFLFLHETFLKQIAIINP